MFVLSMKTTRPRLAAYGVVLGLVAAVLLMGKPAAAPTSADGGDAKRVAYLQEQGYEVEPQWTDVREITVPDVDPIPAAYRGCRIKCFTYVTATGQTVCLYEYNGRILGTSEQGNEDGTIG
ncbi:MAG: hypothetical protein IJN04_03670 [Clostridia bacterium]|nr:hypothetical protein [Clostridia bacterium]